MIIFTWLACFVMTAPSHYALYDAQGQPASAPDLVGEATGLSMMEASAATQGLLIGTLSTKTGAEKRLENWARQRQLSVVREHEEGRYLLPRILVRGESAAFNSLGRVERDENNSAYRIHLPPGIVDPETIAVNLRQMPGVEWAFADEWLVMERRQLVFNDPYFSKQWTLHNVDDLAVSPAANIVADMAWMLSLGTDTIVAVLDDGFSMTHEDLLPTYFKDAQGQRVAYDFVDNDSDPSPQPGDSGHGTRVLGVAAARGNNGIGITGVCPQCRTIPLRVYSSGNFNSDQLLGPASVVAAAMRYAAAHGARIINNSWGPMIDPEHPTYFPLAPIVDQAIQELVRQGPEGKPGATGVMFTWAAGNNFGVLVGFDGWASDRRIMSVAASNARAQLADYSDIGPQISLMAPSSNYSGNLPAVPTTDQADGYSFTFGGTSAAAPVVAGVAALVLHAFPNLSLAQLFEVLLDSADKIDAQKANYDLNGKSCTHGQGRINAQRALLLAQQRQDAYASGYTLHYELCGDGIDNDNNPLTPDDSGACARCIPTKPDDPPNGIDDDCDGYVDNPVACVPVGAPICGSCKAEQDCQTGFHCTATADGNSYCLHTCSLQIACPVNESCQNGLCLPVVTHHILSCADVNVCHPTNNGIETCDGLDNDCNGIVDDVSPSSAEYQTAQNNCVRDQVGVCTQRTAKCDLGTWECQNPNTYQFLETLCDGLDNDCNGLVDENNCPPISIPNRQTPNLTLPAKQGCNSTQSR